MKLILILRVFMLVYIFMPMYLISTSCSSVPCSQDIACECLSRSVFVPRSITHDATFELASTLFNVYYTKDDDKKYTAYHAYNIFYQRSRPKDDLARYFLPGCKSSIRFNEYSSSDDVNPLWLNLLASPLVTPPTSFYRSQFTICPRRTAYGITDYWHIYLTDQLWFSINTAFVRAKHELNPLECNREGEGALEGIETMMQALNNPDWCFGKLCGNPIAKTGLDDIQFKIGYDCYQTVYSHIAPYIVITAPTGRKPRAHYLFESRVGTRNAALGAGFNGSYVFYQENDKQLVALLDLKYRYAFKATERRSFDLTHNGDWSRYLLIIAKNQRRVTLPGINLMTMPASVTPRDTIELFTALPYQRKQWNVEVGYNFWWRNAEKVCIECPLAQSYGIFDLSSICRSTITTASKANISQGLAGTNIVHADADFVSIKAENFNLCSATHPRVLSHTFFGTLNYDNHLNEYPITCGLGGSYEISKNAGALDQWSIWLNLGISI